MRIIINFRVHIQDKLFLLQQNIFTNSRDLTDNLPPQVVGLVVSKFVAPSQFISYVNRYW